MSDDDDVAEATGFSSVSDCVICHEIDASTQEFYWKGRIFYLCKNCMEKGDA